MDELLAIGEFSARSRLSAKVLRSYAAAGLLVPAAVGVPFIAAITAHNYVATAGAGDAVGNCVP